jgi:hypothetical protein
MAKTPKTPSMQEPYFEASSPLAKQPAGGLLDPYTQGAVNKANKQRGISHVSPKTTTEALAYSNGPLKDCWTPAFDRPDMNQLKLRPRYDGQQHRLPEGDGQIKRNGKRR